MHGGPAASGAPWRMPGILVGGTMGGAHVWRAGGCLWTQPAHEHYDVRRTAMRAAPVPRTRAVLPELPQELSQLQALPPPQLGLVLLLDRLQQGRGGSGGCRHC